MTGVWEILQFPKLHSYRQVLSNCDIWPDQGELIEEE